MLITYTGLVALVREGVIEGVEPDRINAASIDVTLGDVLLREDWAQGVQRKTVDLAVKQTPAMIEIDLIEAGSYDLKPGEFVLASTREIFHLPDDVACEFRLKSSIARAGLDQALAVWCDPGWHGSALTMELRNNLRAHWLTLRPGMPIGQMIFWCGQPVPVERSYAALGQYNGDRETRASKGLR